MILQGTGIRNCILFPDRAAYNKNELKVRLPKGKMNEKIKSEIK